MEKMIMKKRIYTMPLIEVMHLEPELAMMKDLNEASLPGHMGGAPARRPELGGNAPVF